MQKSTGMCYVGVSGSISCVKRLIIFPIFRFESISIAKGIYPISKCKHCLKQFELFKGIKACLAVYSLRFDLEV